MRILGEPGSINVRKVLWTAADLQLGFRHELPDQSSQAFLTLSPMGFVPVMVAGDLVMTESNAICRYLAARHGDGRLLPPTDEGRAQVERWMDWQISEVNPAWSAAFSAFVRGLDRPPEAVAESRDRWNRVMAILDRQLAHTGAYVAGDHFTLADIVLGLSTHRWNLTPMERPVLPEVAAWMARLEDRPAFGKFCRADMP